MDCMTISNDVMTVKNITSRHLVRRVNGQNAPSTRTSVAVHTYMPATNKQMPAIMSNELLVCGLVRLKNAASITETIPKSLSDANLPACGGSEVEFIRRLTGWLIGTLDSF